MAIQISLDQVGIADFCKRHRIRKLALFGSVLRDDFRPDSDVDVLVEFLPDARTSLLTMSALERELSAMIGRQVDLHTPEDLSRYFRQRVLEEAEVQFAQAG